MRNFLIIFCREFRETVRSRFFAVTTVLFCFVVALMIAAVVVIGNVTDDSAAQPVPDELIGVMEDQSQQIVRYTIAVADMTDGALMERTAAKTPMIEFISCEAGEDAVRNALSAGADACVTVSADGDMIYYRSPFVQGDALYEMFYSALSRSMREIELERLGLSPADASAVLGMQPSILPGVVSMTDPPAMPGEADIGDYIYGLMEGSSDTGSSIGVYLMATVLFMAISFYGQMVSGRVTQEKSSRMIEVLSTSATPTELLCGKVLGVGAAGLAQISVFFTIILALVWQMAQSIAAHSSYLGTLLAETAASLIGGATAMIAYFVLGFLQLAFIYGGLGAMASTTESVSGFAAIPLQLPMLGYFLAMLAPVTGPSAVLTVASYIPLLSPFVMLARISVEQVALWKVAISLALLVASVAGTAVLSARLYRRGMLRYGQPPKLCELIAAMKKQP